MKNLTVLFLIIFSGSLFAEWELVKTTFKIKTMSDLDSTDQKIYYLNEGSGNSSQGWLDIDYALNYVIKGDLIINEKNIEELETKKTVIKNVTILYQFRGYYIDMFSNVFPNKEFQIMGLEGNKVGDIFNQPFRGYKGSVGAAFFMGVNPNSSFLMNRSGLIIADQEKWLTIAIGGKNIFGYVSMTFYGDKSGSHHDVSVETNNKNSGNESSEETFENIIQKAL